MESWKDKLSGSRPKACSVSCSPGSPVLLGPDPWWRWGLGQVLSIPVPPCSSAGQGCASPWHRARQQGQQAGWSPPGLLNLPWELILSAKDIRDDQDEELSPHVLQKGTPQRHKTTWFLLVAQQLLKPCFYPSPSPTQERFTEPCSSSSSSR